MPYIRKVQTGIGTFSSRIYSRGSEIYKRPTPENDDNKYNVSIKSVSGALVGNLRTDIQRPIISYVEFDVDNHGSNKFKMTLSENPPFPILPYSIVQVNMLDENFYTGIIDYQDTIATDDVLTFTGFGLRNYLNDLKIYDPLDSTAGEYTAGTDISDIIDDIAKNWIAPYSPIGYNAIKIKNPSSVALYNDIELSKYPISHILDIFSQMTGFRWFVDGAGEFNFNQNTEEIMLFLGYDFHKYTYTLDHKNVKNSIIVKRKEGKATGGAGWVVGGLYNSDDSIHKYGKKEYTYQVPGYFSDDDCNVVGNAILTDNKDPKPSVKLDNFKELLYVEPYDLHIVNEFTRYEYEYDDCSSGWLLNATGDLTFSYSDIEYVDGQKSLLLEFKSAIGDKVSQTKTVKGRIFGINFYAESSIDIKLKINILNSSTTISKIFDVKKIDSFVNINFDIENYNLVDITGIEFEIVENLSTYIKIYIDRIMLDIAGCRHDLMQFNKLKYKLKPDSMTMSIEAGTKPTNIENFLTALFSQADELNFTEESI